jgi:hypothetical protein
MTGKGHGRTEKRPGRHGYLASGQPPGADPPWRSGQLSAVCHNRPFGVSDEADETIAGTVGPVLSVDDALHLSYWAGS